MKNIIINILKRNGISTKTLNIKKTDVRNYDAAFFCNSIRKIWNIRSIGNIRYQSSDLVDQIKILIDENVWQILIKKLQQNFLFFSFL